MIQPRDRRALVAIPPHEVPRGRQALARIAFELIAARFNDTASLAAANARLDAVTRGSHGQKEVIEQAAAVLKELGTLNRALDKLLATAILFV
jgi:hypothetical protein